MDALAVDGGAFAETIVFLSYFKDLPDIRQRGKVMYPLAEVLLLCLMLFVSVRDLQVRFQTTDRRATAGGLCVGCHRRQLSLPK